MRLRSERGSAVVEFLAAGTILAVLLFATIQLALLWAGRGAVETAAHFAARKFALNARTDIRTAQSAALAEASLLCRNRPGARWADAAMTKIDFSRNGRAGTLRHAVAGEAFQVRLTHWFELVVPWVDRVLYAVAPGEKTQIGNRYYLALKTTRWVTVE